LIAERGVGDVRGASVAALRRTAGALASGVADVRPDNPSGGDGGRRMPDAGQGFFGPRFLAGLVRGWAEVRGW